jgi:hypothetical protein
MFRVIAETIPVTIALDREDIDFRFSEDSQAMFTYQICKLTNNGNAAAHYEWKIPEDCVFYID